uniref:Uncharacterized protein n=1 Tax=Rhizophora mucronata TaxID=61149 RepID=A0A2P2MM37_RHIMU
MYKVKRSIKEKRDGKEGGTSLIYVLGMLSIYMLS